MTLQGALCVSSIKTRGPIGAPLAERVEVKVGMANDRRHAGRLHRVIWSRVSVIVPWKSSVTKYAAH
jgi:hypothetical protein